MDRESLAINAVSDLIAKTDFLVPHLNSQDKIPIWDGEIFAYSDKSKSKEKYIGKAPVQVKGKSCRNIQKTDITYPILVSDLKHYRKDGGVLFFVVLIDENKERKVYYNALLPYEIHKLLAGKAFNNKLSVKMYSFPTTENDICNTVINFINNSKKQYLHRADEVPSIEDFLKTAGNHLTYGFSYTGLGYDINKPYEYLFNNDVYLYVTNSTLNVSLVIDHMWRAEVAQYTMQAPVAVAGIVYYDSYDVTHKTDSDEIHVGKSVVFRILNKNRLTIDYNLSGTLSERIKTLQFVVAFLTEKYVNINNVKLPINPTGGSLNTFDMEAMSEKLSSLKLIKEVMNILGVKKDLDMSKMTQKDIEYIKMLIMSLIEKKSIVFKEKNIPPVANMQINNINVMLHFKPQRNGYKIENYMEAKLECSSDYTDGSFFETSKFTILKSEDFIKTDNLNYSVILAELLSIQNPGHYIRCNYTLLEMLKAYDKNKEEELLNSAIELAEWLLKKDETSYMAYINVLQSVIRKRKLLPEEENRLLQYLESEDKNNQLVAASYILLGDKIMANKYVHRLDEEDKKEFQGYPIYNLMIC